MCDQGTEVIFRSNGCSVCDLDTGKIVIKGRRRPNNLYIFEEGKQRFYLSKNDEHWLWHRRLGHLSFSQIRKACKYQAIHGLPDIKIPDNTICKSCQFGKQTRTNFPKKEGSASKPLEHVVHLGKGHLEENNTLYYSLTTSPRWFLDSTYEAQRQSIQKIQILQRLG